MWRGRPARKLAVMVEPPVPSAPAPRAVPSAGPKIALALGVAMAVIAAGTVYVLRSAAVAELDQQVPASAGVYMEVNLRPPSSQREALDAILGRLTVDQRADVASGIDAMLEDAFAELDLSWRDDVKGWIGSRVAFTFPSITAATVLAGPKPVGLMQVRDEQAARASLQRALDAAGDGAFEIQDGVAFIGPSSEAIEHLRTGAERAPLSDDAAYQAERARHGDVLAFAWFNAGALAKSVPQQFGSAVLDGGSAALRAEPEAIVLEGGGAGTTKRAGDVPALLGATSAEILAALTLFDLGTGIEAMIDPALLAQIPEAAQALAFLDAFALDLERDLAAWLKGELSLIIGGFTGPVPDVGALIEVTDEKALDRTARTLRDAAPQIAQVVGSDTFRITGDEDALQIHIAGQTVFMRRARGRVAFAPSERYAMRLLTSAPDALADDAVYQRAVGDADGTVFQAFVRLDRIVPLFSFFIPSEQRADLDGPLALIGLFESAAITATGDGRFRMALTVAQ